MAYGHITCAVFVVDLFETDETTGVPFGIVPDGRRKRETVDRSIPYANRVKINNTAWNDQALDAVFGMLTSDILRCVILFINKSNAFNPRTDHSNKAAVDAYESLAKSIRKRAGKRTFEVILGSAGRIDEGQDAGEGAPGEGLVDVKKLIRKRG